MPNMRLRNRRALDDKTPGNTPVATGKRKGVASPTVETAGLGLSQKLPALKFDSLPDAGDDDEPELSSLQELRPPAESTSRPDLRSRKPLVSLPGPSKPPIRQKYSPLPPSSPPSVSSDLEYETVVSKRGQAPPTPPPEPSEADEEETNKENDPEREKENLILPVPEVKRAAPFHKASSSDDDPFGFSALERRLKAQRDARRHSFVPLPEAQPMRKGKETARPRAPLGELSFDRGASGSVLKERPPTPYHESDDLEDMYLDPNELSKPNAPDEDNENSRQSPPTGLEGMEAEMDEEEEAELAREHRLHEKGKARAASVQTASSVSALDALRTPRPQHVANIYPLRSPFSSVEGTPCDRSLPGSPLSSPSPMKPMTVLHTLPVSSVVKARDAKGKSPAKARLKALIELPPTKRRRVTLGKENSIADLEESGDPTIGARDLQKPLPKQPAVRRSGRINTADSQTTRKIRLVPVVELPAPIHGRRRTQGKGKILVPDSTSDVESDGDKPSSPVASPIATRKRKALAEKSRPVKKAKTAPSANTSRAVPAKRGRPKGSGTKPASKRKAKAKDEPEEDSDAARKRRERLEYFKKLDEHSLEKEDVYII
ncbi:hypothetical protein BDW22DRAFT_1344522 [Trametopsis cervina]|nr:hypothetical protein BDW22DRAFT_1344522 [Trametopsis cervina]